MATLLEHINQGTDYTVTVTSDKGTSGATISAIAYNELTQAQTILGQTDGAEANTEIQVTLNTSELTRGNYFLEVWVNKGQADQFPIYPNESDTAILRVVDRIGE